MAEPRNGCNAIIEPFRLFHALGRVFYFNRTTGDCLEILTIEIINWEKHNPKRDQKSYTWLRLNNDICTDPELFGLDPEQKFCWIEILCQASRKNNGTITVNLNQISDVTKVSIIKISKLIQFLQLKPIIKVHDRALPQTAVTTTPTYERDVRHETNATNVRDERISPKRKCVREPADKTLGSKIWDEYAEAYEGRYGTPPVRNAAVNSKCTQLAKRLGEDAPAVARFFVSHNRQFYVLKSHPIGMLLADAEGLHTEWVKGKQTTNTEARAAENKQQIVNAWAKHLEPEEVK